MKFLKKFQKNKSGLVWIWSAIIILLLVYSVVWFTTGYALTQTTDVITSLYTYQPPISYAVDFILAIFQYHPLLFLFGLGVWAYVMSQRRANY